MAWEELEQQPVQKENSDAVMCPAGLEGVKAAMAIPVGTTLGENKQTPTRMANKVTLTTAVVNREGLMFQGRTLFQRRPRTLRSRLKMMVPMITCIILYLGHLSPDPQSPVSRLSTSRRRPDTYQGTPTFNLCRKALRYLERLYF